jgi:hypothetical protein
VNTFGLGEASERYRQNRLKESFAQLQNPDPLMEWAAVRIIGDKGTSDDILSLLKAGVIIQDQQAKQEVPDVILELVAKNQSAGLPILRQAIDDPALAETAMMVLCQSGTTDDLKRVAAKVGGADPAIGEQALQSLTARRKPDVGPVLLDLYKSSTDASERDKIAQVYLDSCRRQQKPQDRHQLLEDAINVITEPKIHEQIQRELAAKS